jgi:hypothetical protein
MRRALEPVSRRGQTVVLVALGAVLIAGALAGPRAFARGGVLAFFGVYAAQLLAWGVAACLVWRQASRAALAIIAVVALAARLAVMLAPPFLSSDVYRYVWDGKLVAHGINPFRFIPAAPELAHLRDLEIYPSINRPDSTHTIYPPLAQAAFALAYVVGGDRVAGMRVVLLAAEIVTALALVAVLRAYSLNPARLILYAWCPLVLWEVSSSAHIDGLAVTGTALALAAYARGSARAAVLTGLSLAAAALTKLYPAVLLPVFFRRGRVRMVAVFMVASGLAFVPLLSVRSGIVGYLPWYLSEEGYGIGDRYIFYRLICAVWPPAPVGAYIALAVCVGAVVAWRAMARRSDGAVALGRSGAALIGSFLLLTSPHYPWYALWLVPFLCLAPVLPWLYLVAASGALYLGGVSHEIPERSLIVGLGLYGGAAVLAAWDALRTRAGELDVTAVRR